MRAARTGREGSRRSNGGVRCDRASGEERMHGLGLVLTRRKDLKRKTVCWCSRRNTHLF